MFTAPRPNLGMAVRQAALDHTGHQRLTRR
jgi:hypothetical protein